MFVKTTKKKQKIKLKKARVIPEITYWIVLTYVSTSFISPSLQLFLNPSIIVFGFRRPKPEALESNRIKFEPRLWPTDVLYYVGYTNRSFIIIETKTAVHNHPMDFMLFALLSLSQLMKIVIFTQ